VLCKSYLVVPWIACQSMATPCYGKLWFASYKACMFPNKGTCDIILPIMCHLNIRCMNCLDAIIVYKIKLSYIPFCPQHVNSMYLLHVVCRLPHGKDKRTLRSRTTLLICHILLLLSKLPQCKLHLCTDWRHW